MLESFNSREGMRRRSSAVKFNKKLKISGPGYRQKQVTINDSYRVGSARLASVNGQIVLSGACSLVGKG